MKRWSSAFLLLLMAGYCLPAPPVGAQSRPTGNWVATWSASPQPVWGTDFIFPSNVPPQLQDQTLHQVARLSVGGGRLRLLLSNAYGSGPMRVGKVTVALAAGRADMVPGSVREVRFGGQAGATVAPGAMLVSDPVELQVPALARVAVRIHLPELLEPTTFHWDARQTSWLVAGDQTSAPVLDIKAPHGQSSTARLLLAGIEVERDAPTPAIAVIGDSITDGATATLDADSRWPDALAERLAPRGVAVLNAGISGGRLLSDGMGQSALARLQRDVLGQPGVRAVVVMIGINDIAWPGTAFAPTQARPTLQALQAGYLQLIRQAHRQGIAVIGTTLTPFEGALPGTPLADYYHPQKDALRGELNEWIRHSDTFDAVIDADAALRDPAHPGRLLARFDSGDHLHPGDEGNRALAAAVALDALLPDETAATVVSPSPSKD